MSAQTKWTGHRCPLMRRNTRWTNVECPGAVIRHCGHPTALRPYYVVGVEELHGRTFSRLVDAQAAVEMAVPA